MRITDNFYSIIDRIEHGDLNDLHHSALHVSKKGSFECFKNHVTGYYYVKCTYLYDTLLLKDQHTKSYFIGLLEKKIEFGQHTTTGTATERDSLEGFTFTSIKSEDKSI